MVPARHSFKSVASALARDLENGFVLLRHDSLPLVSSEAAENRLPGLFNGDLKWTDMQGDYATLALSASFASLVVASSWARQVRHYVALGGARLELILDRGGQGAADAECILHDGLHRFSSASPYLQSAPTTGLPVASLSAGGSSGLESRAAGSPASPIFHFRGAGIPGVLDGNVNQLPLLRLRRGQHPTTVSAKLMGLRPRIVSYDASWPVDYLLRVWVRRYLRLAQPIFRQRLQLA